MRKSVVVLLITLLLSGIIIAQAKPAPSPAPKETASPAADGVTVLPVKRVVLYKNGVGYFEHSGKVRGNQDLSIEFTTAQLNDVLKSLTAVDLGGGQITGVRYNSIAPLSERLKTLQIGLGENVTAGDFLNALRGTRVEVRSGSATVTGKVLSVETVQRETAKGGTVAVTQLSIVGDGGELRSFEMGPGVSVRIVEGEIRQDIGRYLGLIGSTRSKDVRKMTISAAGTGERPIMVSYISEVPVWKSTYRIVVPKAPGTPFIQGWAIVDNTVGEDWKDVQLSLVSGSPQSFIQNISQPYYTRRPVIALPESVMLAPQEHEASMMEEATKLAAEPPPPPPPSPATAPYAWGGGVGGGPRSAAPSQNAIQEFKVQTRDYATDQGIGSGGNIVNLAMNGRTTSALRAQESGANGGKLGDLFEYALKQKITVMKNQSALVPIVQSPVEAQRITMITANGDGEITGVPLRGLWLRNTTGLMLDGGTFNVLEQDAFAGEGVMDVLHANERRLLSYAADTAIHAKAESDDESGTVTKVRIYRGELRYTREERSTWKYEIHNSDSTPRDVVIEHPIRDKYKLVDGVKPEESSTSYHRFKVRVEPQKTGMIVVKEAQPDETVVNLSSLANNDQVVYYTNEANLKPEVEQAFRKIVSKKNDIAAVDRDMSVRQKELAAIDQDQARVRENMKALKGSAEEKALLQRYTKQLDSQEDRINALRGEINQLQTKRTQLQAELDKMIQNIDVDENL